MNVSAIQAAPLPVVVFEGESMAVIERTALVDPQVWPDTSGGKHLWWHGDIRAGDQFVLGFEVKDAGRYRVDASLLKAPDYGIVRMAVDDMGSGRDVDLYADRVTTGSLVEIGVLDLSAGVHRVTVTMVGANEQSKKRMFGLDNVRLQRVGVEVPVSMHPSPTRDIGTPDDRGSATDADLVLGRQFVRIYDPSVGESGPWYINDHTFIRDEAGIWHLIGITHAEPAAPLDERHFAHATASSLQGPWTKQPFALDADLAAGEVILWAPHIIREKDLYYMFYCAGDADHTKFKLHVATSPDLKSWKRSEANPLLIDGFDARDPMVIRVGDDWVMYYTGNSTPAGGDHVVFAVTSKDLLHWSGKRTVFTAPRKGREGGPTESPFVVRRGNTYYLFCGAWEGYLGTYAFKSSDPFHFEYTDRVGSIDAHAAEIVRDEEGRWFASHCGWGQGGVYLAPLKWNDGFDDRDTSLPPATGGTAK